MAKIAFDIDDTITDSSSVIKRHIIEYNKNNIDKQLPIEKMDLILRGFFDHELIDDFFKKNTFKMSSECELREDAKEIINKLSSEGHEIYIITARSDEYYGNTYEYCKNYLDSKGVKFNKIITSQLFKVKTCKEEKIDIMVDDGVDTCDNINKEGIKAFLYSTPLNEDKQTISDRVYSWKDLYNKIQEYLNK